MKRAQWRANLRCTCQDQKEGNGDIHRVLRFRWYLCIYIRNSSSHRCASQKEGRQLKRVYEKSWKTHPQYSRIVRYLRRLIVLGRGWLFNPQVLHIAATEDDIFVDIIRRWYFFTGPTSFGAKRDNLLERDRGVLGIDFVEGADIATGASA